MPGVVIERLSQLAPDNEFVQVFNVDGLGPVVQLAEVSRILRGMRTNANGSEILETAIQSVDGINRVASKRPVVQLAPEFYNQPNEPKRPVLRIEIESDDPLRCASAADLADLAYGIDDGQVSAEVRFLD